MGNDSNEAVEMATTSNNRSFKVHRLMCMELMKSVDNIAKIFPRIEAARPRSSGIQALCMLSKAIDKAKLLLQYCSESSKLYLALTGDVILSRCIKSRALLEQSLCQVQGTVPVILAAEISQVIEDLSVATFVLDPYEEEAGKAVKEIIQKGSSALDSADTSEVKSFQLATLRLHITSPKTVLIEKRSIKKLMDKVSENDSTKMKILTYFLYLFKKYGNLILVDQPESDPFESLENAFQSSETRSHHMLGRGLPAEEFRCPISSRVMYDPVVIASGQTFERMWIQKWFDEGHDTCPKTNVKLTHFSMTPNFGMKEIISKWSSYNGVVISDPHIETQNTPRVWDSSCTSIASLGSSMNDLHLQMDFSNISLGSINSSLKLDYLVHNDRSSDKFHGNFLSKLGELSWESQCKTVEDVKHTLRSDDRACNSLSSENFIEPLVTFMRNSRDTNDTNAQRDGFQLLLMFVSKNRNGISLLREDVFEVLASFLDSKVAEEAFSILEILSAYLFCKSKIMGSGCAISVLGALDSPIDILRERSLKILCNLSSNHNVLSQIPFSDFIPKLVPLMRDQDLAGKCVCLMKNMCESDEIRASIAETKGCIASIAEVLENGDSEEQENAVNILLSLCSQRLEYCYLVLDEGIFPPLWLLSVNGNETAKASAHELLRQLKDVKTEPETPPVLEPSRSSLDHTIEKKPVKSSGFFGRKISVFGKKR